ncbi:MAG: acyl carrier protein [Alphaproteobacteria bacterium]
MNSTEIYEKLTPVFRDVLDDEALVITAGLTAKDVDEWDSLSHVRLILSVEKAFGVHFSTAELAQFDNVGQLADMIADKLAAGS